MAGPAHTTLLLFLLSPLWAALAGMRDMQPAHLLSHFHKLFSREPGTRIHTWFQFNYTGIVAVEFDLHERKDE